MNIKLNCDMGESFGIYKMGQDEHIMPYIDMANLACGFHASDSFNMNESVELAVQHNKVIGAHPSYQDLVGFGRRTIHCSAQEITAKVLYQIGALSAFCKVHNTHVSYVKPHGALYNDMMKDETVLRAILKAISSFDKSIKLMILSSPNNNEYKDIADSFGVELIFELFADRNYTDDGFLVPRTKENAVLHSDSDVLNRLQTLKESGYILSENGKELHLQVDTVCVHGDHHNALDFVKLVRKVIS